MLVALVLGLGLGWLLEQLARRHLIPDFLHGVVFLSAAVGALVVSNAIQSESGLFTVTILGIFLGNRPELHLQHVEEFSEHLQVLLVGMLFVMLAGRIAPAEVVDIAGQGALFVLILVLVVRPVSVLVGLWGTPVTRQERTLLAFMAPRGIVAAAVASIFGLEFLHAAERTAEAAAEATGAEAEALRMRADSLMELAGARQAGLRSVTANILSEYAVQEMELPGIRSLIAGTADDEVNATAAREIAHVLGRANVYQLARSESGHGGPSRTQAASHLSARIRFQPPHTHDELDQLVDAGHTVKRTTLTPEFGLDDFRAHHGEDAVLMFVLSDGDVTVLTPDTEVPQEGVSLVALVPPRA